VEDKLKILKPILSRFCEIYVYLPKIDKHEDNFYNHNNELIYKQNNKQLFDILNKLKTTNEDIVNICEKIYKKGFSGVDILNVIGDKKFKIQNKYELLTTINKERLEYYNEKMFILVLINTIRCNLIK